MRSRTGPLGSAVGRRKSQDSHTVGVGTRQGQLSWGSPGDHVLGLGDERDI